MILKTKMGRKNKYSFSFTTASLAVNEMVKIAELIAEGKKDQLLELAYENDFLGKGNRRTSRKLVGDLSKRILNLDQDELNLLVGSGLTEQKQLSYLAVCKTFQFIHEFVVEVVREKFLIFDYQINESDYSSFLQGKIELHPEIEKLTEGTISKVRQVTFKILEQVGIIDTVRNKQIQPQWLSEELKQSIHQDNPEWLKIFLMSDKDIEQVNK